MRIFLVGYQVPVILGIERNKKVIFEAIGRKRQMQKLPYFVARQ